LWSDWIESRGFAVVVLEQAAEPLAALHSAGGERQHPRRIVEVTADDEHQRLLTRYKSALAVTEYYLRNPREKKKGTTH
jgi:hypothetical protein